MAILIRLAGRARSGPRPAISYDDLARELRLPPQVVRNLCFRLVDRGLLAEAKGAFTLKFDPAETAVGTLVEAVERDPALAQAHRDVEEDFPPAPAGSWTRLAARCRRTSRSPSSPKRPSDGDLCASPRVAALIRHIFRARTRLSPSRSSRASAHHGHPPNQADAPYERGTQPDAARAEDGTCADSSRDERARCGCRSRRPKRGAELARARAESRAADLRCRTSPGPRLTRAIRCRSPSAQRAAYHRFARPACSEHSNAPSRGHPSIASG